MIANRVRDHRSLGQLEVQRGQNQLLRNLQQLDRKPCQFLGGQAAVTIVHRFGQRIRDAGANPDHRRLLDAEPAGNCVSGLEADAADVAGEPIGVLGHDLNGIGAVGLVDPNGARRADAVAMQEDHDLAHDLLLRPGSDDAPRPDRADAIDLTHPIGLGLDDVEHLLAEGLDHLPGIDRADAADHAGGEIRLDALDRTRRRGAHEIAP